ncbi:ROK family transcriptional regulator [Modestobacter roseus]|uniref:ROK family transcriptional regulator n=1 Tax=Modestobacter roseus TaxID=1181884 RepID=UPI001AA12EBF|nr:ROK family transcriptional regulator [Modestobacter roseus]
MTQHTTGPGQLRSGADGRTVSSASRISGDGAVVAALAPPTPTSVGVGVAGMLALLRDGNPRTRPELVEATGLARSTVAQRVDALLASGLVQAVGEASSTGGRPPTRFAFDPRARLVLAADLDVTSARLALTDMAGVVLAIVEDDCDIAAGPEVVLEWVCTQGLALLSSVGQPREVLLGVGIGLPGPVEHATGRPVSPPIMPGWDGFDVVARLEAALGCPAVVDNDVNVMALGERSAVWPATDDLVFVKVSTGIGSGIISDGALRRGARGAAGDLGHVQVARAEGVVCRCGNTGCLEAVAGGGAMVHRLRADGVQVSTSADVARLGRAGVPEVVTVLRDSGRLIGQIMADVVSLLNPSVIVIGGALANDGLLAGVREVIYRRTLPLAALDLRVELSQTGDRAGVLGAAAMVVEHVLAPPQLDRVLA